MKFLILAFLLTTVFLQGCSTTYHSYYQADQSSEWEGPFYGGANSFEENVKITCNQSVGFSAPYAVRIHMEGDGETRTYVCSEYPKYQ